MIWRERNSQASASTNKVDELDAEARQNWRRPCAAMEASKEPPVLVSAG